MLQYRFEVPSLSPLQHLPRQPEHLERVEAELMASVRADDEFLTQVSSHLIVAGGKRLRPSFVIASALSAVAAPVPDEHVSDDMIRAGVSVELVHLGSLYHDDVMDDAATRHAVESVNYKWGNLRAILAGDFLLARASEIAASLGTEVAELLAATITRLCEGQVRELQKMYDVGRTEEQYFAAIAGKTAALYSTACRIGGIVAELPRDDIDRLTRFGLKYGVAYQIVDDILDVVSTDEDLGKPAGKDLLEGIYTLPVIRCLASDSAEELTELLGRPLTEAERDKARSVLRSNRAIDASVATAAIYANEAVSALVGFGDNAAADGLRTAAISLIETIPG